MSVREGRPPETCDICATALKSICFDGATRYGPWAWMCRECFVSMGVGLGTGKGQAYIDILGSWLRQEDVTPA